MSLSMESAARLGSRKLGRRMILAWLSCLLLSPFLAARAWSQTYSTGTVSISGYGGSTTYIPDPPPYMVPLSSYSYVQVTVNGIMVQGDAGQWSASTFASDLVSVVNVSSAPVTASLQSSTVVLLTSKTPGPVTYTLSATTCWYETLNGARVGSGCTPNVLYASSSSSVTGGQKLTPAVSLSCSPNPVTYNVNTTCKASVSGGGPTPTGNVTFVANGGNWTTVGLNGSGQASVSGLAGWAPGTYPMGANYAGDGNYLAGSGSTSLTIGTASSSTSVTSSANPAQYGNQVTFTATVSPSAATGTVTFYSGGTVVIGSATLSSGSANLTVSTTGTGLGEGGHTITAAYSGNTDYGGSTSGTLNQVVSNGEGCIIARANRSPWLLAALRREMKLLGGKS